MIRVFDAFSGIGGFRSAFERVVGFKTVRMKQLKLFEKHMLDEYISTELHLNDGKAGGG